VSVVVLRSDLTANELLHDLEGVFPLGPREEFTEVRTYQDTFDWRLHRSGFILSNFPSGDQVRLALEDAEGNAFEILIPKAPLFASDLPLCSLKSTLEPVVKHRRLFPEAEASWTSVLVSVLKQNGTAAVRLLLREGTAHLPDGMGETSLGTRVEILPLTGGRAQVRKITAFLKKTLHLRKEKRAEAYAVYEASGKTPGDFSPSFRLKLRPGQSAERATRRIHRELLRVLLNNQEGVSRDWDKEFLHDFRVSLRRTRSALKLLDGVLPKGDVDHFSKEFRWLGMRTGKARDLDVHLLRMPSFRAALDPSAGVDLEPLVQLLREKKRKEHRRLRDCLKSKRYLRLISEWRLFLEKQAPKGSAGPHSKAPIEEVAQAAIQRALNRVLKPGRRLGPKTTPKELHRLRIDCKNLRYLLTFFRTLLPAEVLNPVNKELKRLQDRLGDFNDLHVQDAALRTFAGELMATKRGPPPTLLAMGRLLGQMERAQAEERAALQQHMRRFSQPRNRGKFEELLQGLSVARPPLKKKPGNRKRRVGAG